MVTDKTPDMLMCMIKKKKKLKVLNIYLYVKGFQNFLKTS